MTMASANASVIDLVHVTKRYHAGSPPAVDDVSLSVALGEAVALMGPSGSGKSTLLNMIAGLDVPTAGTIPVAEEQIDGLSESRKAKFRRRKVGIIFQLFNLLDNLTVTDNVVLGQLLCELNSDGQTLVLVTHSSELAQKYARRVVYLVDGRIAESEAATLS